MDVPVDVVEEYMLTNLRNANDLYSLWPTYDPTVQEMTLKQTERIKLYSSFWKEKECIQFSFFFHFFILFVLDLLAQYCNQHEAES